MPIFHQARFFTTANELHQLPEGARVEIAFAGRSNAGKSSAINTLCNQKRLAYTSKTPGRTQHLNYFSFGLDSYLVDLPGYGYAKVPERIRRHWEEFLAVYLAQRDALRGMVLIMDARHPLTDLDKRMLDWFTPTGKPVHVLLSKADKLTRNEQAKTLKTVKDGLKDQPLSTVSLFSSLKRTGTDEVEKVIATWLNPPATLPQTV